MAERVIKLEVPFFDPMPDISEPALVQSEHMCFLVYWDRDMKRQALEFSGCSIAKFGYPNDEALAGHSLYSKGLGFYDFFEVLDSEWISELRRGNAIYFPNFVAFRGQRHFIITFHDTTFECIASDFQPAEEFPRLDSKLIRLDESL